MLMGLLAPILPGDAVVVRNDEMTRIPKAVADVLGKTCGRRTILSSIKTACNSGRAECPAVPINQSPWSVMIANSAFHLCTGTIISDRHILTAAHCLYNTLGCTTEEGDRLTLDEQVPVDWLNIYIGSHEHHMQVLKFDDEYRPKHSVSVVKATSHPGFCNLRESEGGPGINSELDGDDVAILEVDPDELLARANVLNKDELIVGPACLASHQDKLPFVLSLAGFGGDANKPEVVGEYEDEAGLTHKSYQIMTATRLLGTLVSLFPEPPYDALKKYKIHEGANLTGVIFANGYGNDACGGDSGGGLVNANAVPTKVFGTVSKGKPCFILNNPFEQKERDISDIAFYRDIRDYNGWICDVTGIC
jgi:hypothetical protein